MAVIYVVDSSDPERLGISKDELMGMLNVFWFWSNLSLFTFFSTCLLACTFITHLCSSFFVPKGRGIKRCSTVSLCKQTRSSWSAQWSTRYVSFSKLADFCSHGCISPRSLIQSWLLPFSYFMWIYTVSEALGLDHLKKRQWAIFKTSAIKGVGMNIHLNSGDWKKTLKQNFCFYVAHIRFLSFRLCLNINKGLYEGLDW